MSVKTVETSATPQTVPFTEPSFRIPYHRKHTMYIPVGERHPLYKQMIVTIPATQTMRELIKVTISAWVDSDGYMHSYKSNKLSSDHYPDNRHTRSKIGATHPKSKTTETVCGPPVHFEL